MAAIVALLRGVNLGGHHQIRMEALKALCISLGLKGPRTYLQSGNVVFTSRSASEALARRIEGAIEESCGFRPAVILRTASAMKDVVARNPFAGRPGLENAKLATVFLDCDPGHAARDVVNRIDTSPEELRACGRELYIYFPNGMGRSKLQLKRIESALKATGTARNWNTVTKLLEIAESLEK
jgi:uncharacterized protein (DUF1697 family)